ncbi:reverse transcriptase family protein [Serratia sp. NA_112.1]|uniref:reverse transcriptase family protein n=1 Tax=Serratia sp. NA_112.1 TaxID=3415665 RepID=UPI004046A04C
MKKRIKLKIVTKNKSYQIIDSPLYKLKSKKKLVDLLGFSLAELNLLKNDEENYSVFDQLSKKGKTRKIQKPLEKLDRVHTRLASLLTRISTPNYLHSGKKQHSNITNANAHVNSSNLLTADVRSFFPSTTRTMIFSFFYSVMKMSSDVADLLSYICSCHDSLPTGSRISMPLAFFANYRMFSEIESLCKALDVKMTVYVDDLTFSGSKVNRLFASTVKKIISRHGHVMHPQKTKLYGERDPKLVTGVIVIRDRLKIRNEQHRLMSVEFEYWKLIKDIQQAKDTSFANKLIGRMHSMGVIDERYKARVLTLRANTRV